MFYSKSTQGFYDIAIHGVANIPEDAIEITAEKYAALLEGQSQGKQIAVDEAGDPVLIDAPGAPFAEDAAAYLINVRLGRTIVLDRLTGIAGRAARMGDAQLAAAADRAAIDYLNITDCAGVLAAKNIEALRVAIETELTRIKASAPAGLQAAFLPAA